MINLDLPPMAIPANALQGVVHVANGDRGEQQPFQGCDPCWGGLRGPGAYQFTDGCSPWLCRGRILGGLRVTGQKRSTTVAVRCGSCGRACTTTASVPTGPWAITRLHRRPTSGAATLRSWAARTSRWVLSSCAFTKEVIDIRLTIADVHHLRACGHQFHHIRQRRQPFVAFFLRNRQCATRLRRQSWVWTPAPRSAGCPVPTGGPPRS